MEESWQKTKLKYTKITRANGAGGRLHQTERLLVDQPKGIRTNKIASKTQIVMESKYQKHPRRASNPDQ